MMRVNVKGSFYSAISAFDAAFISVLTAFNIMSLLYSLHLRNGLYALSSIVALVLVMLPYLLEYLFSCRISRDLKIAYWFLAVGGPVCGNVYRFYHYIRPWDKILHMLSGFLAAAAGYALPDLLLKEKPGKAFKCLFAVSFSMAVGGIWEIYEYIVDVLFHMDMQNDTVITEFSSYLLGDEPGTIGTIKNIQAVYINGEPLDKGYIDIGLIDTMKDMIQCMLGSLICVGTAAFQKPDSCFASIRAV